MASMVFAPSPLSIQSLVNLRTNSNYPRTSSCYVPSPSKTIKNSYVRLSYNNISHIDLSKSSFTKGDVNFSFPLPKFPKLASTLSPSLNIIKACGKPNIYHFGAVFRSPKEKAGKYIELKDEYEMMVLLIVNIPDNGSRWPNSKIETEIEFLNYLHRKYRQKSSSYKHGFEVLGFLHDNKDELPDKSDFVRGKDEIPIGVEEILRKAEFPIFERVKVNDNHEFHHESHHESHLHNLFSKAIHNLTPEIIKKTITKAKEEKKNKDLWYFLRTHTRDYGDKSGNIKLIEEEFEKFLVDGDGIPACHLLWFTGETARSRSMKEDGGDPGVLGDTIRSIDPTSPVEDAIKKYFP